MKKHTAGELAYWDTFSGLVPCKVLTVTQKKWVQGLSLQVRLTATRGAYKRGETTWVRAKGIVPRSSVRSYDHKYVIVADYEWIPKESSDDQK